MPGIHSNDTGTEEYIGCLLLMDDVALITENHKDIQEMLNIIYDVANKYPMEFGRANGKILKIGKTKEKPSLHLGNKELEYVQTCKYLGETMNNKGTMENHIKETIQKPEAAYQTILAIMGNKYYNNIELETAWKLIETCIQPIITYGGESWNINKKEQKSLNRIQENIIRRVPGISVRAPIRRSTTWAFIRKHFPFVPTIEMSTLFSFLSKNQINAQGAVTDYA